VYNCACVSAEKSSPGFTALPECVTHVVHGLYSPGGLSKYSRQGGEGGEERERFTSPGEMRSKDSPAGLGLTPRWFASFRCGFSLPYGDKQRPVKNQRFADFASFNSS
jgi:hypothetical protein